MVVRVLLRRWPVVLGSLMISLFFAYAVMQSVAATYEAKGSVLLYAPSVTVNDDDVPDVNPFRSFDASTAVLTSVLAQIMNDPTVRESVAEDGGRPDYQIGGAGDGTPVLNIISTDSDPDVAIGTILTVQEILVDVLDRRQAEAGAPENARIRSIVLTTPSNASELVGGRIRAFAAVAAIGIAASVSLAFIVENLAQSRRLRAQERVTSFPDGDQQNGTNGGTNGEAEHPRPPLTAGVAGE